MVLKRSISILFVLFCHTVLGQVTDPDEVPSFREDEMVAEDQDVERDFSPLDVLKKSIPNHMMRELTSDELIDLNSYIQRYGDLTDVHELRRLFPIERCVELAQYYYPNLETFPSESFNLTSEIAFKNQLSNGKKTLRMRGQLASGYKYHLTVQQDVGEEWRIKHDQIGWDYGSYSIQKNFERKKLEVILGDFDVQFAEGLALGQGFRFGIRSDPRMMLSQNVALRPHRSVTESGYMRGIGMIKELGKFTLIGFVSSLKEDATIHHDSEDSYFLSISNSSNTPGSSRRKTVRVSSLGTRLQHKTRKFIHGINLYHFKTDIPLYRRLPSYSISAIPDKDRTRMSYDMVYSLKRGIIKGEAMLGGAMNLNFILTHAGMVGSKMDYSIQVRRYSANTTSFHSNAPSFYSKPENESGITFTVGYLYRRKSWLRWLYSHSKRRTATASAIIPAFGETQTLEWRHRLHGSLYSNVAVRHDQKDLNLGAFQIEEANLRLKAAQQIRTTRLRWQINSEINENTSIRYRADYTWLKSVHSSALFGIDLNWKLNDMIAIRTSIVRTTVSDGGSPLYSVEYDIRYNLSVERYYHNAIRAYSVLSVKLPNHLTIMIKMGATQRVPNAMFAQEKFGINNDLKIQLSYRSNGGFTKSD